MKLTQQKVVLQHQPYKLNSSRLTTHVILPVNVRLEVPWPPSILVVSVGGTEDLVGEGGKRGIIIT